MLTLTRHEPYVAVLPLSSFQSARWQRFPLLCLSAERAARVSFQFSPLRWLRTTSAKPKQAGSLGTCFHPLLCSASSAATVSSPPARRCQALCPPRRSLCPLLQLHPAGPAAPHPLLLPPPPPMPPLLPSSNSRPLASPWATRTRFPARTCTSVGMPRRGDGRRARWARTDSGSAAQNSSHSTATPPRVQEC
jgi:hypothetical protein